MARARRPVSPEAARSAFGRQRERLQAQFLRAAATGKPRGLRWIACEFGPEWELARDRQTGQLLALAGVTVRFEAEPGGDMEGLPAVANPRQATAVFVCERGRWTTAGRVVFNLGPAEALAHFHRQYERVPEPGGETNRREG